MMTNEHHNVLYIGVTSDLVIRVHQHKTKEFARSFTAKYNCYKLVYSELFHSIEEAIDKERKLKSWKREWKNDLINQLNPEWRDLSEDIEKW